MNQKVLLESIEYSSPQKNCHLILNKIIILISINLVLIISQYMIIYNFSLILN